MRTAEIECEPLRRAPLYGISAHAADILVAAAGDVLLRRRGAFVAASAMADDGAKCFNAGTVIKLESRGLLFCRRGRGPFRNEARLTARGRWFAATILAQRAEQLVLLEAAE
jgi:hypothetical protein